MPFKFNPLTQNLDFYDPSPLSSVSSLSNVDGTLTISPTTGAVVASLNLASANTWTAKQTIQLATEQLRLGYDVSNYYSTTVSSAGAVTFDAVGSAPKFTFSDSVEMPANPLMAQIFS